MPAIIEFAGVEIRIVDRQGRPWVTQRDVARALYGVTERYDYAKGGRQVDHPLKAAERQIMRLLSRNQDEFTDDMTALLLMETAGGPQQVRIYSARGCYLMGMFAKTALAKQFRRWVLDVLEGKFDQRRGVMTPDQIERRLRLDEGKLAIRALDALRRASGNRAAALAAPLIYAALGINIDPDASDTLAQGELSLDDTVH